MSAPSSPALQRNMEWFPKRGYLKLWRKKLLTHLLSVCNGTRAAAGPGMSRAAVEAAEAAAKAAATAACGGLDVYEFGVFTGRALKVMAPYLERHGMGHALWGFDSFVGIPQDAPLRHPEFRGKRVSYASLINSSSVGEGGGGFAEGGFNTARASGVTNVEAAMREVHRYVRSPKLQLIPGFYNESLTPSLARERGMRPALYVDVDVDIYVSTYQALDWMLRAGLIVRGTVIGYDDYNYGLPATSTVRHVKGGKNFLEGEARAHSEIVRKWGLHVEVIKAVPRDGGESGWAFTVVSTPPRVPVDEMS